MQNEDTIGKIVWCSRQKKGIRLTAPNENLCDAYLKKANDSLKSMNLNMSARLFDWTVDAAYYARYHAIYALLQKCGIKSEIHDCSITLISFLFGEILGEQLIEELERAKEQRINLVYYTNRMISEENIRMSVELAPKFVLAIEKTISELNNIDDINNIIVCLKNN